MTSEELVIEMELEEWRNQEHLNEVEEQSFDMGCVFTPDGACVGCGVVTYDVLGDRPFCTSCYDEAFPEDMEQ